MSDSVRQIKSRLLQPIETTPKHSKRGEFSDEVT
jgi:hypothetical protein